MIEGCRSNEIRITECDKADKSTYLVFREVVQTGLLRLFNDRCEPGLQEFSILALGAPEERGDLLMVVICWYAENGLFLQTSLFS